MSFDPAEIATLLSSSAIVPLNASDARPTRRHRSPPDVRILSTPSSEDGPWHTLDDLVAGGADTPVAMLRETLSSALADAYSRHKEPGSEWPQVPVPQDHACSSICIYSKSK
ncbi:hypothetical protein B0H14DRAFT_3461749 [Mycena olivaceomarginata]|nr:hypothetical protein B0H14DRAFT_3461749 [Mycena olivaceomarginata]